MLMIVSPDDTQHTHEPTYSASPSFPLRLSPLCPRLISRFPKITAVVQGPRGKHKMGVKKEVWWKSSQECKTWSRYYLSGYKIHTKAQNEHCTRDSHKRTPEGLHAAATCPSLAVPWYQAPRAALRGNIIRCMQAAPRCSLR